MKIENLVKNKKYKFNNELFISENASCFGIDTEDKDFLFNSEEIIFSDFCWYYSYKGEFSGVFLEKRKKFSEREIEYFAFYIKGFSGYNDSIKEQIGRNMWFASSLVDFSKYLEDASFIQEEMDV